MPAGGAKPRLLVLISFSDFFSFDLWIKFGKMIAKV